MRLPEGMINDLRDMYPILHAPTYARKTILIVEDDEPLLRLLRLFLHEAGYNVLSAQSGEEAVDTYRDHREDIDLVLTDLGLPGLTGKDEMLMLERINPEVRIICASGYLEPTLEKEMIRAGAKAIVYKPYEPQEILLSIRTALETN